jgi:hypothetical protein
VVLGCRTVSKKEGARWFPRRSPAIPGIGLHARSEALSHPLGLSHRGDRNEIGRKDGPRWPCDSSLVTRDDPLPSRPPQSGRGT